MAISVQRQGLLNQQDVLKIAAILLMLIDHIGAFWLPDMSWLRAIGRISLPIWAFFLGYNLYASNQRQLLYWGLAVFFLNALTGASLLGLNILFGFWMWRKALDVITQRGWAERYPFELVTVLCISILPFSYILEYGTLPLLFALAGRAHRLSQPRSLFLLSASGAYILAQCSLFTFNPAQIIFVTLSVAGMVFLLWRYTENPMALPQMFIANTGVLWLARYSLLFYVFHRAFIQMVGLWLYPERIGNLVFWGS